MTEAERLDHRRRLCTIDEPIVGLPEPIAYMNVKTGAVRSLATLQRDPEPGVWRPFNLQAQVAPLIGV